jgi:hypothetical protein
LFTPDEQLLLDEVGFSNNTWPVFKWFCFYLFIKL